ncbi:MAG: FecR domain-containing protein, partial [Bacteroidaceae bacterium]
MEQTKLLSYLNGELNNEDSLQVETWCESSEENSTLLEQLYYITFLGERAAAMGSINIEKSFAQWKAAAKRKEKTARTRHFVSLRNYVIPFAAFFIGVIVTAGFSFFVFNKSSNYIVETAAGQRAQFVLPDGSRVWLNSATQLVYKTSVWSRTRQVNLSGEAYFEVAHNKRIPFVVNSKHIKVQVLGTKFNVRARPSEDKVVTTLLKGSVRIDLPGESAASILLQPGQTLNVNAKTLATTLTNTSSAKNVLAWMSGKLIFEKADLEQITRCLERHFDVQFHFDDEKLKKESFTCEFLTDDDITSILSVLSMAKD